MSPTTTLVLGIALFASAAAAAEPITHTFADAGALEGFKSSGPVSVDAERSASEDGSGSLHLGPGASVIVPLRQEDGSGRVAFSVYEDGSAPADPKKRVTGAFWGVRMSDGMSLVPGAFYAPYLAGADSYAISNHVAGDTPYGFIKYLGIKRQVGWHRWVFDFDPKQGLTISCDGAPITQRRFDWNESKQAGFNSLIFHGDASGAQGSLWIDDIEVTLGGPMETGPEVPTIVPESDPAVEGEVVTLVDAVVDVHPRVLFGPERLEEIKAFYHSDAGAGFRADLEGYLGASSPPKKSEVKFLKDATDGQRQGYWRMPTVALHYLITGDQQSFDKAKGFMELLLELPHWETGGELDSGMSAANIMIGAGLTLDWLWNDLDPEFREAFRQKCLWHARAMYHGGHLLKSPHKAKYWQADPANNHRWHRNAGIASCLYAAASGAPEEAWIMTTFKQELDFIMEWLPADGTSHESPGYMTFGISHLIVAAQAADRCIGTEYLEQGFFENVPRFKTQALGPGFTDVTFNYGDQGGTGVGKLNYDLALYLLTGKHGLKQEQAALDRIRAEKGAGWGWMALVYYHPEQAGGEATDLPTSDFFEDIGVLWSRESWVKGAGAVQFKCGPLGGYTLNHYRNENDGNYINVAHDDPDANSFILIKDGEYVAETDRYSMAKMSANHNTILINGSGQIMPGYSEPMGWMQPARGGYDMTDLGVITAVKLGEGVDLVEGEAAGSYLAVDATNNRSARPALDRYRRALAHVKGRYVLVLDDIRAPEPVTISWLVQGKELTPVEGTERAWVLAKNGAECPFRLETDRNDAVSFAIVDSPSSEKKKQPLGWRQLRAEVTSERLVVATAFDLYGHPLDVALDTSDPSTIVATVTVDGQEERWEWIPAEGDRETYELTGTRGNELIASHGPEDRPEVE